jgi:hypothetical protein
LKIIFLHGEILEFSSFFFFLKIFFKVNGKGHNVTHPLFKWVEMSKHLPLKKSLNRAFFSWLIQVRNGIFVVFSLCYFTFEDMNGIEFMVTLDYKLPIRVLCPTSKRNRDGFSNFI